ncbi:MAG: hypothetical protein DU489_16485 [Nitrosomonas sp.]|uniref:YajG family lipoprotein n=1 Tax=Nitrosomonas sp. TaxID=42353 RepID=UPI0032EB55E4
MKECPGIINRTAFYTKYRTPPYSDHKMGFFSGDAIADLNMSVTVKSKKGDQLYSRQVVAQGIEPNTQLAGGENAKLALNRALENGMKALFEDQAFLAALVTVP